MVKISHLVLFSLMLLLHLVQTLVLPLRNSRSDRVQLLRLARAVPASERLFQRSLIANQLVVLLLSQVA